GETLPGRIAIDAVASFREAQALEALSSGPLVVGVANDTRLDGAVLGPIRANVMVGNPADAGLHRVDDVLPVDSLHERAAEAHVGDLRACRVYELRVHGRPGCPRVDHLAVAPLVLDLQRLRERDRSGIKRRVERSGE